MAKHKQVDPALAQGCAALYTEIYKSTTDQDILNAYTESITFDRQELIDWLNQLTSPSVKIALGVYTKAFVNKYPEATEGRLSTFLWPVDTAVQAASTLVADSAMTTSAATTSDSGSSNSGDPLNTGTTFP